MNDLGVRFLLHAARAKRFVAVLSCCEQRGVYDTTGMLPLVSGFMIFNLRRAALGPAEVSSAVCLSAGLGSLRVRHLLQGSLKSCPWLNTNSKEQNAKPRKRNVSARCGNATRSPSPAVTWVPTALFRWRQRRKGILLLRNDGQVWRDGLKYFQRNVIHTFLQQYHVLR